MQILKKILLYSAVPAPLIFVFLVIMSFLLTYPLPFLKPATELSPFYLPFLIAGLFAPYALLAYLIMKSENLMTTVFLVIGSGIFVAIFGQIYYNLQNWLFQPWLYSSFIPGFFGTYYIFDAFKGGLVGIGAYRLTQKNK